ncbi:heavy metal translocating P-type ATPase [Methyloversatilis discipulorum]|uniref:heavy metal translocating P-type ATPase n=1 Tax=Methyloversatilis discipulorum TaxID=1119528 RepID=UPI003F3B3707
MTTAAGWLHVPAMDCVTEESEIRRALERLDGIRALTFRLSERNVHIDATPAIVEEAADLLRRIGFDARPVDERPATAEAAADEHSHESAAADVRTAVMKLAGALVLAIAAELVGYFVTETTVTKALGLALAGCAIALAGFDVYKKGIAALLAGRLNINALMSVAVTGAVFIGQWAEAAMVMALYTIAELIEARAVERARHAITGLMAMAPETATVRQSDGEWRVQPVGEVPLRAVVRIGPGERVPLDGVVVAGNSSINQAPVTGESIPVDKEAGDPVFAGTINENGLLEVEVTALAANSTLARIIHAVEQAEGNRAPTQRFVDRFAAVYTPAVFVFAVLIAVSGPWLFGLTWLQAIYKALVLLVIACPCALVISTPVTVVSGLAAAARRGILIKGGVHLEGARHLKAIAFDKTGTITEGKPRLVEWSTLDGAVDRDQIAAIVASLAGHSDHPVSKAIADGLPRNGATVLDFKALPGRGVSGTVDGRTYVLGNHRLIEERGQCSSSLEARLRVHETAGRTVTVLASDGAVLGVFAVADGIKAHSADAVAELKALGVHPLMLSGDNSATARTIAEQAGIDDARGDLLPTDKLDALKALQQRYGPSGMIGDGINDAPALAQSNLGFAMGAIGTDTAMEAADIVIMNDDLRRVPETIRLSRRTSAILWQNISFALGIKAVFFVLALFGSATMWMAVFADMGASLLVVANGLRLLRPPVGDRQTQVTT